MDGLDDDVYEILEAQAIQINEQAKAKHRDVKVAGTTQIIGSTSYAAPEVPREDSSNSNYSGAAVKVAVTPLPLGTTSYAAAPAKHADPTSCNISRATAKVAVTLQAVMTSSTGTPSFSTPEAPRADSSSSKHSGVAAKVAATPSYAAALAKDADPTSSKISRATAKGAGTPQDVGTSSHTAAQAPQAVGDLSITPEYAPPPRREHKLPAALQSPYLNGARKVSFSCSRAVTKTYNAVCMFSGRSTRSKNRKYVYHACHLVLNYHLAFLHA